MSLITSTTDGHIKILSSSLTRRWQVFESALEATTPSEVFPLPLSDEEFELWVSLSILIDSDVARIEDYYLSSSRCILAYENYVRIVALMDLTRESPSRPEDEWRLYCIPGTRGLAPRYHYAELGYLLWHNDIPLELISQEVSKGSDLEEGDFALIGLMYCEMVVRGCRVDECELVVDPRRVDWSVITSHCTGYLEPGSEQASVLLHYPDYEADEYDLASLRRKRKWILSAYPSHLSYLYCIRYLYHAIDTLNQDELFLVQKCLLGIEDPKCCVLSEIYDIHSGHKKLATLVDEKSAEMGMACINRVMNRMKTLARKRYM